MSSIPPPSPTSMAMQILPTIIERRRASEEERAALHIRNLESLNRVLQVRADARVAELNRQAREAAEQRAQRPPFLARIIKASPTDGGRRASDTSVLQASSELNISLPRRRSAAVSQDEVLDDLIDLYSDRRGSAPVVGPSHMRMSSIHDYDPPPPPRRPSMPARHSSSQHRIRTPRHFYEVTSPSPTGREGADYFSPRGSIAGHETPDVFLTPMGEVDQMAVDDAERAERRDWRERAGVWVLGIGMALMAVPVVMMIGNGARNLANAIKEKFKR